MGPPLSGKPIISAKKFKTGSNKIALLLENTLDFMEYSRMPHWEYPLIPRNFQETPKKVGERGNSGWDKIPNVFFSGSL